MITKQKTSETVRNLPKGVTVPTAAALFMAGVMAVLMFGTGYLLAEVKANKIAATTTPTTNTPTGTQQDPPLPTVSLEAVKGLFGKDVVKFGNGDKKLLFVEVSDPSCPYCHVASGTNTVIGSKMGAQFAAGSYVAPVAEMRKLVDAGKADFVWLYTNGHGNGELATKALYCAQEQGKFWQANDLLMTDKGYNFMNTEVKNDMSKAPDMGNFLASAVDKNKLVDCIKSGKYDSRLQEDTKLAQQLGVNGTPGFFINDKMFAGAYSWTSMKVVADDILK